METYYLPLYLYDTTLRDGSQRRGISLSLNHDTQAAYVGVAAYAHKGGIHIAAVEKVAESYEHINPHIVGNDREIVVSELS